MTGLSECYLSRLEAARGHFEHTISIHDTEEIDSPVSLYGAVLSRGHLARMLLYLGYPDRSRQVMSEAFAQAERLRHPIGFVNTFWLAAQLETLHRNARKTEQLVSWAWCAEHDLDSDARLETRRLSLFHLWRGQ